MTKYTADYIKSTMKKKGQTLQDLANFINANSDNIISRQQLSNILNHKAKVMPIDFYELVSSFLNIPYNHLFSIQNKHNEITTHELNIIDWKEEAIHYQQKASYYAGAVKKYIMSIKNKTQRRKMIAEFVELFVKE